MRPHRTIVLVAFAAIAAAAIVACTLNPQPLPPDSFAEGAKDSDASADAGSFGNPPPGTPSDAAGGTDKDGDADAGSDAGSDASDAGDAADADGG